ncbi:DNA mismatch repair endonuclease MutL [candidate division KSB1 bacterium]|nr:DNA mismatch repair endonuclease MutL [candidate division KSB1 bacterium]NIR68952.1 DNA mismatch repair endonuclease MutL [candidate division KSB1 bacterium]NIS27289.1 DNA mismatch repair endonuclease MutL [candidate division KSB1 bacterium]NIT74168.1 DNA mismatch repair endonuclease MutL [candidate division KSB1 bacterium]NIU28019.1 DNA mismatch repair endonuclease MutL [candidate division KSB1 bacterium]
MQQNNTKIKILPENLTNKIAAGEVIDRPASVVKELVENSIDAGASEITVVIAEGGKSLIQVVDDGAGMSEADLLLAFQRHATSKIFSYEDLIHIHTLGFRGEALASIASVSRVEAKSIVQGSYSGHLIRISGGVMDGVEGAGGNPGTSITVKNLFYNTPARRKFLRATNTEYRQILKVLNRFFLACPQIAFSFVKDGEIITELQPESLEDRVRSVFGGRIQKNLIPIENEGSVRISGFTGNQDTTRATRGDQYLYFNKRYFTNKSLHYAVLSAYGDIIPKGHYPVYVVFLEMEAEQADVNVHPTKMEIKFANESLVFSSLRGAVKRALSSEEVVPQLSSHQNSHLPHRQPGPFRPNRPDRDWGAAEIDSHSWTDNTLFEEEDFSRGRNEESGSESLTSAKEAFKPTHVWQVHNKYILSQIKNGVILIDQHVAHERILYEQALERFEKRKPSSQQLLFPQIVELSSEDYSVLLDMIPFLEQIGFVLKAFGKNTVVLEGVPSGIKISDEEKILLDIIDEYKRGKRENPDIRDNVAKSFACHSAIKAGDPLSLEAMNSLIDQLFSTKEPYFCPHGRPVLINLSLEELDRRFRRH